LYLIPCFDREGALRTVSICTSFPPHRTASLKD